jgi:hypothetical protein
MTHLITILPLGDTLLHLHNDVGVVTDFLVSSCFLKDAIPFFRSAFTRPSHESETQCDGKYHISMYGFDVAAMEVVLHQLHGNYRFETPSLDLLVQVARVVEYYDLREHMAPWAEAWIDILFAVHDATVPSEQTVKDTKWLFVAWVFDDAARFEYFSGRVLLYSREYIDDCGFPMPQVIDKLETLRCKTMVRKVADVRRVLKRQRARVAPYYEAGTILRKLVASVGEIDALAAPYFGGLNYDALCRLEIRLRELSHCSRSVRKVGCHGMARSLRVMRRREPVPCLRLEDFAELC